ncbi:extracellular solute-binding protein [Aestuariimicrobium soli]|uniref:extracellular solute-binding protein n=1 Tax=Aestuariimicrobium soli TaxID=2035834 RepID=UPI003EBE7A63
MIRRRSLLSLAAATAAGGLTLAGCGSDSGTGSSSDQVTYMTWESNDTNAAMDATFKTFTEQSSITMVRQESPNTDYAQKLASLLLSKKAPDFFWCSTTQAQNLAAQGLVFDWTSHLKDSGKGLNQADFAPGSLELYTAPDGTIIGIPTLANTYGVFYNKDMFKAAGLAEPTPEWTYDEMLADAKALTGFTGTKGPGLVTAWSLLASPQGLSAYSVANGGAPFLDKDLGATKVTASPQLVEGAQKLADAVKAGHLTAPDFDATNSVAVFSNGGNGMLFGGQWLAQTIKPTGAGFEWGYAPWPRGSASAVQPIEANGVCSPATLKNPDATYQAIAYMLSKGFNEVMAKIPVAPIAYTPGSTGYFDNLEKQGGALAAIGATAKYELGAEQKFGTQMLDPWATKAGDIITAKWTPALGGKTDLQAGITATVTGIQGLIDSEK